MRNTPYAFMLALSLALLSACQEEYLPPVAAGGPRYVVEGHVEAGDNPIPAYVILTRTFDFYGEFGPDLFSNSFVHDALVKVSDGQDEVVLTEVCLNELDPVIREQIAAQFGFAADSLVIDFCVYIDVFQHLQVRAGGTYSLSIVTGTDTISAVTTVPPMVALDSLRFAQPPGKPSDTLAQLRCFIADPPGVRNFYRYFGSVNGGAYGTGFGSVTEDLFFDGKAFEFQLFNPQTSNGDVDPEEIGLYYLGDSVSIKWCTMDEPHFDFWNTLEFSKANQGPFASYTRLQSNVTGALGVWGGYNVRYYDLIVAY